METETGLLMTEHEANAATEGDDEIKRVPSLVPGLDGLSAFEAKASSSFEMTRIIHELQALALATDCSLFLLTTPSGVLSPPEHTLVDGVIELQQQNYGPRNDRRLLVHTTRGSS